MASIDDYNIDTSDALRAPSRKQLRLRIDRLPPGLYKLGACYQDLLDVRPRDSAHYNDEYFNRDGAMCLAWDIDNTQRSAVLETAGIQYGKFDLGIFVNTKSCDDVPHDNYSPARPGALYVVPVRPHITTQQQFEEVHVSYYLKSKGKPKKPTRKTLLKAYLKKIPMQQLRDAFSGRNKLSNLVVQYGFKSVRTSIFNDLKAQFAELGAE